MRKPFQSQFSEYQQSFKELCNSIVSIAIIPKKSNLDTETNIIVTVAALFYASKPSVCIVQYAQNDSFSTEQAELKQHITLFHSRPNK